MLRIRNNQLEAFGTYSEHRFERSMQDHLREYFPAHVEVMGPDAVRRFVSYALERARRWGFRTQRSACIYLNAMMVLGAGFDEDPVHGWAAPVLQDRSRSLRHRSNLIATGMLESFEAFAGKDQQDLNEALLRFYRAAPTLLEHLYTHSPADFPELAAGIYPARAAYAGTSAMQELARQTARRAGSFGFRDPGHQLLLTMLYFLFGAGLAQDPHVEPLSRILNDPAPAPEARAKALLEAAAAMVRAFIKAGPAPNPTIDHV